MRYRVKTIIRNNGEALYYPQYKYKYCFIWFHFTTGYCETPVEKYRFEEAERYIEEYLSHKIKSKTYKEIKHADSL